MCMFSLLVLEMFHPEKFEYSRQLLDIVGTKIGLDLVFKLRIHRKVIYMRIAATEC